MWALSVPAACSWDMEATVGLKQPSCWDCCSAWCTAYLLKTLRKASHILTVAKFTSTVETSLITYYKHTFYHALKNNGTVHTQPSLMMAYELTVRCHHYTVSHTQFPVWSSASESIFKALITSATCLWAVIAEEQGEIFIHVVIH